MRNWLALAGLVPPFALAFYSLTQPWARARVVVVWGVSRNPGPEVLAIVAVLAVFSAGAALVWGGRRPRAAAFVHMAAGVVLGLVGWKARSLVLAAGARALASAGLGTGLLEFALAAGLLLGWGLLELGLATRRNALARPPAVCDPEPVPPAA